ncbi:glutamate--cysteine ligase [Methylocystis parvus]|uniref:Glutamate--cysteine ligase n=1 Tax=Methylocystis parvus TaxID=134 RepID=A0A6B8M2Z2_9HYPH|nr:glutamate--cysteine ligase [Methylocystis parvus]QGM98204.1 glutamate--cysteine ligase [Methylocystis parvus]WBK01469.1 glutamate--cysteine ligase [Methylocystis parvus OBBP]
MARDVTDTTPIASRDALVEWLAAGCKTSGAPLRVGTEHEKIPFYSDTLAPVPYSCIDGRCGVGRLLEGVQEATGWAPIMDRDALIGLAQTDGGGAISIEPGGQFELSGAPLLDIHATDQELGAHLSALAGVAHSLGVQFLDLGASPRWSRAETPVMPKQRYEIMAAYMPKVGSRGLDMMFRTATIQANLDFTSEADMVEKVRVGLALQPLVTALFANSPFLDGKPTGRLSQRSYIWLDTDADRTGMLPFAFEDGFGFERYVDYALDVPMYFVKRGDFYHDVAGASFRDLLEGRLPQLPGERAVMSDWANHLSTIFPEVRIKTYLEMRGADGGPRAHMTALPALFAGLFYDYAALDQARQLSRNWDAAARQKLREDAPGLALDARIDNRSLREIGRDVLAIAAAGLKRRAYRNAQGADETIYLAPLEKIVSEGRTLAQRRLDLYHGAWGGSVDGAFRDCVIPL